MAGIQFGNIELPMRARDWDGVGEEARLLNDEPRLCGVDVGLAPPVSPGDLARANADLLERGGHHLGRR